MILEHVAFKLVAAVDRGAFLRAAGAVDCFLSRQPGFIKRELFYSEADDSWIDLVWWDDHERALAAADAFAVAEENGEFMALIAKDGLRLTHLRLMERQ